MTGSKRFKPIQQLAERKERDAAAAFGKTLRDREAALQRLQELQQYHGEYLQRFDAATRMGMGGAQIQEYLAFIGKLEQAIAEQQRVLDQKQHVCDDSKQQWRGQYTRSRAMDTVLERMRADEQRERERREQAASDERNQRRR